MAKIKRGQGSCTKQVALWKKSCRWFKLKPIYAYPSTKMEHIPTIFVKGNTQYTVIVARNQIEVERHEKWIMNSTLHTFNMKLGKGSSINDVTPIFLSPPFPFPMSPQFCLQIISFFIPSYPSKIALLMDDPFTGSWCVWSLVLSHSKEDDFFPVWSKVVYVCFIRL